MTTKEAICEALDRLEEKPGPITTLMDTEENTISITKDQHGDLYITVRHKRGKDPREKKK